MSSSKPGELAPVDAATDQTSDEQKLVAFIRDKVEESRISGSRTAYESIWLTNVAYLLGFSGVSYDPVQRQYKNSDPGQRFSRRQKLRVNKILPTCQNRLARLCKSPPRFDVRPNSNSTQDKDAARLGVQIIENILEKQHFDEKRQELFMSTQQYGYSFIQTSWDPTLGKPMIDPDSGNLIGYEGDIRIEVLNPFEVFTDPLAKKMDDLQWWIKAKVRKLSYFKQRYPERGDAVKEEDAWLLSTQYDQRISALTSAGTSTSAQQQMKNSAIELAYYEKRSKDYPNGRMIVCAGGILLEDKELPIGEIDLVKFDDIYVAGKFQSEAIITHLRPIQDQFNLLINKRSEWVRKMLAGKYIVARGAGLEQEAMTDGSGEMVHYNVVPNAPNGGAPIPIAIPLIPQYAYNEEKQLDAHFDFVSGLSEISRGQLPFAGIPAEGMQILQESDETRIGIQTTRNELGYARVGQHILQYISKYYQMPRMLKIAGDGLEYTVKEFVGADLKDNYDVFVLPGSTIPGSKVLRRQEILNAYNVGILGPVGDPKVLQKLAKMLEYGDVFEIWKSQALDDAQVKKFIKKVEDKQDITQNDFNEKDNHLWWAQELNEYRKTDKFEALDKDQKLIIEYAIEWHVQAQVRLLNPNLPKQHQLAEQMVKALHNMPPMPAPAVDPMGNPIPQPVSEAPQPQQMPMANIPPMGGQTPPVSQGA